MCPTCRDEATDDTKCTRCGKKLSKDGDNFVNPNFDKSRFEKLENGEEVLEDEDIIEEI